MRVRRAPKFLSFTLTGGVLGAILGALIGIGVVSFDGGSTVDLGRDASLTGFFAAYGFAAGMGLGLLGALLFDWLLRRRAREVSASRESFETGVDGH